MKKNIKRYTYGALALSTIATLLLAVPALADNNDTPTLQGSVNSDIGAGRGMGHGKMMVPGVFGTVTAISGNTITISGKQGFATNAVATTFTVDATNAKIMKAGVVGTISSVVVGDTIFAQGTVIGANVVATMIRDGIGMNGQGRGPGKMGDEGALSGIVGNGQPVVAGTVTVVNGNTITITNKSNVTYTVDATNAKITKGQTAATISNVAVNDTVIVQGTVNGNSITASTILDQMKPTTTPNGNNGEHKGFFGGIGSFFAHIFGF